MSTTTDTPKTFSELIRKDDRFTERDLQNLLKVNYRGLKQREDDPSKLSMAQLMWVATVFDIPLERLVELIKQELKHKPDTLGNDLSGTKMVVGRMNQRQNRVSSSTGNKVPQAQNVD